MCECVDVYMDDRRDKSACYQSPCIRSRHNQRQGKREDSEKKGEEEEKDK